MVRRARHAAIVATAVALAVAGIEIEADRVARAGLRGLLIGHPDLAVAGVSADPFRGRLTLRGVRVGRGRRSVTIGRLDLPMPLIAASLVGPADAETQAPSGGAASAENVTIVSATTTFRIKRVDIAGTRLSNADLARLVDPASPEPIESRLRSIEATAVTIPQILVDDTTSGSERHAAINQVLLSGVIAGKVASGSAGDVTFAGKDGDASIAGRVGTIAASGVDLPQIAHVFESVRTDAAEPMRPLFASMTASGIEIRNETKGSVLTLATLKETGAEARALESGLFAGGPHSQPMTEAEKASVTEDVVHSFAIGGIEATDLAAKGTAPDEAATFDVTSLSLKDLGDGKVAALAVRALRFEGRDLKLGVEAIAAGPLVLPRPKGAANPYATNAMVPSAATADLRQLDIDIAAHPDGGAASHTRFTVAHAGFASQGAPDDIPQTAKVTVDHLGFDLPPSQGQAQPLAEMGYGHLDVSAALTTHYDGATHVFDVQPLILDGVGMGTLDLSLQLANVTRGVISSNQEVAKAAAFSILAKGLALHLVNAGLIDRAIAWKAKKDGLDVAKEKAFLSDFFGDKLPASLGESANVKIVGTAIAKFVNDPRNLRIAIASQSGLGVGSMALLADPGLLIDTLEVKASANE